MSPRDVLTVGQHDVGRGVVIMASGVVILQYVQVAVKILQSHLNLLKADQYIAGIAMSE